MCFLLKYFATHHHSDNDNTFTVHYGYKEGFMITSVPSRSWPMILFIVSTLLLRSCVASVLPTSVSSSHCAVSTLTSCAACSKKKERERRKRPPC